MTGAPTGTLGKALLCGLGLLSGLVCLGCAEGPKSAERPESVARPNLVLIIADDMGWNDRGACGNPAVHTPNIDRLAGEGLRFDHAYLTASSCSPSRASILTGRYPHATDAEQLHWPLHCDPIRTDSTRHEVTWNGEGDLSHLAGEVVRLWFELTEARLFALQFVPRGSNRG
jgi:hypothetical protein